MEMRLPLHQQLQARRCSGQLPLLVVVSWRNIIIHNCPAAAAVCKPPGDDEPWRLPPHHQPPDQRLSCIHND